MTSRLLAFMLLLACVASHYLAKPARDSYMLAYWGTANLPWLNMGVLVLVAAMARVQAGLFNRRGAQMAMPLVGAVAAFTYLLAPEVVARWPRAGSLLVSSVVGMFNLSGLATAWAVINSLFPDSVARRRYTVIGLGGQVGAVLGAVSAQRFARIGGAAGTLRIAAGAVVVTTCVAALLVRHLRPESGERRRFLATEGHGDPEPLQQATWRIVSRFHYTRLLLTLTVTISALGAVIRWALFRIAEVQYHGVGQTTVYFADAYGAVSIASVAVQLVLTPIALRRLGPTRSLFVLPTLACLGAGAIAASHNPEFLWIFIVSFLSLEYTVNQCAKELLYVVSPVEIRFKAKQYIDSVGRQVGVLFGNGMVLLVVAAGSAMTAILAAIVALASLWTATVRLISRDHKLLTRSVEPT